MKSTTTYFLCQTGTSYESHRDRAFELALGWRNQEFLVEHPDTGEVCIGFVCHRTTNPSEPDWVPFIRSLTEAPIATLGNGSRQHALVGLQYAGQTFLLAFGSSHLIAKKMRVYRRFGRVVAGNQKGEKATRRIATKAHDQGNKTREETIPQGAESIAFDALEGLSSVKYVSSENRHWKPMVADGGVGYRYWCPDSVPRLFWILDSLTDWWNGGVHLDDVLASLERFGEVEDPLVIAECNKRMFEAIAKDEWDDFGVCMPADYWHATAFEYRMPHQKAGARNQLFPWQVDHTLRVLKDWMAAGERAEGLDIEVHVEGGTHKELAPAVDLLTWTLNDATTGGVYVWDEGAWYYGEQDWVSEVLSDAQKLFDRSAKHWPTMGLPQWASEPRMIGSKEFRGEDLFIEDCLACSCTPPAAKCHREMPPKPLVQVEICDVFWLGKFLLFCKDGTSFSPVQEVCGQTLHALKAIRNDMKYVRWAETHLRTNGHSVRLRGDRENLVFGVLLAVADQSRPLKSWSIRSLYCLNHVAREVGAFNSKAGVFLVPRVKPAPTARAVSAPKKSRRKVKP